MHPPKGMPRNQRSGYKRPGGNDGPSRKNNRNNINRNNSNSNKNNGGNANRDARKSRMNRQWLERGMEIGGREAIQIREELASREKRLRQDEEEAVEREERLNKRERQLSDWQQRLAAEKDLSQVNEELQKKRVKVINGLRAQLQKQAREVTTHGGCTCKKSPAAKYNRLTSLRTRTVRR